MRDTQERVDPIGSEVLVFLLSFWGLNCSRSSIRPLLQLLMSIEIVGIQANFSNTTLGEGQADSASYRVKG